jgi:hypothetical protein
MPLHPFATAMGGNPQDRAFPAIGAPNAVIVDAVSALW